MRFALPSALLLSLAACGSHGAASHPRDAGAAHRVAVGDAGVVGDAGAAGIEIEVQEGWTLWDIGHAYGVDVDDILAANRLRQGRIRSMSKGLRLRIPGVTHEVPVLTARDRAAARDAARAARPPLTDGAYVTLSRGETLTDLSRRYDVDLDAILTRNQLDDDDVHALRAGDTVIVPGIEQSAVRERPHEIEREGISHTVERGESIWDIARMFRASVGEIMAASSLDADDVQHLTPGTRLYIPGVVREHGHVERRLSNDQRRAIGMAHHLGLGTRGTASAILRGDIRPTWIRAAEAGHGHSLPGTLRWPVANGRFVRGYGSGLGGYHQAIDICGELGTNVRAAAPGIVAYSGDEVPGYGNLVMVVHPGGWATMYAHNSANYVVAGQRVATGAVLAELGSTGISRGPHSHFELFWHGMNCDPALLMRPGIRHAAGRIERLHYVTWSSGGPPPGVSCDRRRRHPNSRYLDSDLPAADTPPE